MYGGVEGGGRFGLVRGDSGSGIKIGAGADGHFDVVQGALGFDDAVPAEGGTGFRKGSGLVRQFAAVGAGFESGDSVAVKNEAHGEIENQRGESEGGTKPAARAF